MGVLAPTLPKSASIAAFRKLDLRRRFGVTTGTIQAYEHGRTRIAVERLAELARALRCEPADLLAPPGAAPGAGCGRRGETPREPGNKCL
jgi:transcriptional regulator with XRE-family HTH domain